MSMENSVKAVEVVALEMDQPVVVDVGLSVRDVLERMREGQYGCVLVTREGRLAGIFTERDVANKVIGSNQVLDQPISELMTADPQCVHENDPIQLAARAMFDGGFRNVPIVDSDRAVVSCIRHKDIIHLLVEHFADRVLNLPPDPENMPTTPEGG
jgi:CBS domain-containing protein